MSDSPPPISNLPPPRLQPNNPLHGITLGAIFTAHAHNPSWGFGTKSVDAERDMINTS